MRSFCTILVVSTVLLSCMAPWTAIAGGTSDEAEVNFALGAAAFERGEVQVALGHFLASNRLAPNANVMYNIARSFEELGQVAEAFRWYADAATAGDAATRRDAEQAMADLGPKVARVDVLTQPAGAAIFVDREDLGSIGTSPRPLALSPGTHDLLLVAEGYKPEWVRGVVVAQGKAAEVNVALKPLQGRVQVQGASGLEVFVDGAEAAACAAPCAVDLRPGLHTIRVRGPSSRSLPVQVQVVADEALEIAPEVLPITGTVVVSAEETGATIEVDGRVVGFTPTALELPVGTRSLRVSRPGFEVVERTIEVEEGAQIELRDLPMRASRDVEAASRFREPIEQAPSSISVITGTELRAFGYPTIYEALRGTRGTALSADSTYSSIGVRGLGQANDFGNRLLILQDGATLNDNILWQSFIGYDGRVDLGDVERIEVVRGAGSVLYGTGAVSGVVNLVTRAPEEGERVHASVGSYDNGVARARVGAHFGGEDRGGWVSVSAARGQGRDEKMHLSDGTVLALEGLDRFQAASSAGKVWLKPVSLQWSYAARNQHIPTGPYGTRYNDPNHIWRDQRGMVEAKLEQPLGENLDLLARAYGNLYVFDGDLPYDGEEEGAVDTGVERYTGGWAGVEARGTWSPGDHLRASVGTEAQYSFIAAMEGATVYSDGFVEPYMEESRPYGLIAAYAVVDGAPNTLLRYSIGGRMDAWTTTAPTFNPRGALILTPGGQNILKLMGGRAFRAPSIYELTYNDGGYSQVRSDFGGNELLPEITWSGEVEYTRKIDEDWSALASVHGSVTDGLVETVLSDTNDPDSPVYYKNSDLAVRTIGVDSELRRDLRRGWMFTGSAGLLRATYADEARTPIANAPPGFASIKLIAPIAEPTARLAFRTTLEAPRVIVAGAPERSAPAVISDLVLSGRSRTGSVEYAVGTYNMFNWHYAMPVAVTFDTATMPQLGRSFLATVTLRR